jgi:hypothetical protein
MVNFFPFFSGGMFQVVMGAILDRTGTVNGAYTTPAYRNIFALCFFGALLSFIVSLFLQESLPETEKTNKLLKNS